MSYSDYEGREGFYGVYHHRGRPPAGRRRNGAGSQEQRAAYSGGHAAVRRRMPHPAVSASEGCGRGGGYPAVLRVQGGLVGRRPAGGQPGADTVRHPPDADAADALIGHLFGGDPGPLRLGGAELSRRLRAGAAAYRSASGGAADTGRVHRGTRRQAVLSGAASDRRADRAGHPQRRRHRERHAGGLRRGGHHRHHQRGAGAGDRGPSGFSVCLRRRGAGRRRLGHHRGGQTAAPWVQPPGHCGSDRGRHLPVRRSGGRRRYPAAAGGLPAPGHRDHRLAAGGLPY